MTTQQIESTHVPYQILDVNGDAVGKIPELDSERMLALYRTMCLGRALSDKIIALQRQGRATTFGSFVGQEAASVGLAAPLRPEDWLSTSYREIPSLIIKGVPLPTLIYAFRGYTPTYPPETHCLPFQIVIGTQILHAVGLGMAARIAGDPVVSVGVCGDGATSEGDFNEALNFAGVFKAPAVIVVQNNGWAISVPRRLQCAAPTLAVRGAGFGIPFTLVDGNDILAVYDVMRQAVDRARSGEGPTLIELLTYRIGAHTTADDPSHYRDPAEVEMWRARDPIARFQRFLTKQGLLTAEQDDHITEEVEAEINLAVSEAEAMPAPPPDSMFGHTSADLSPRLQEQRADLLRYAHERKPGRR